MLCELNTSLSSSQKTNYTEAITCPSLAKTSNLIKPDLSQLLLKENQFSFKKNGFYKNRNNFELETPIKMPQVDFFSPIKIEGRDLFGIKEDNNIKCYNNIDLDEFENPYIENGIINKDNNDDNDNFDKNKEYLFFEKNGLEKNLINNTNNINLMENNFTIIKTLSKKNTDAVYKVKENATGKILCIKKISEKSNKNNFNNLKTILEDIQKYNTEWKLEQTFCMKYIKFWLEDKNFNLISEDRNYLNKNMYILTEYYKNGDVLDYLEKLEKHKFKFTSDFYWDLVFEMIIGLLYVHQKGYIHFDIKPTNYLVNNEGFVLLNDFGLSHKEEELAHLTDIKEGDSKYISKELLNTPIKNINNKTDIFSLGLTFLEIIAKIELPSNGNLWRKIRDMGGDIINDKIFKNSNINNYEEFEALIKKMISPVNERPSLLELIKETNELNKRYELLMKKTY